MNLHISADVGNYIAFVVGQNLFLLKRAGSAIRNPTANVNRIRDYYRANWDIALVRLTIEGLIFWAFQYYGLAKLVSLWGWTLPSWLILPNSFITYFPLGYAADSILDWLSMSPKLPNWIRTWIAENVPQMPVGLKLQNALGEAAGKVAVAKVAAVDAKAAAEEAEDAISKAQDVAPKP